MRLLLNLPAITSALADYLPENGIFHCTADATVFVRESRSYEWNAFLNGASYNRPQDLSPTAFGLVEVVFGGRINTPLLGDAEPYHKPQGEFLGKNALFFDGRVEKATVKW